MGPKKQDFGSKINNTQKKSFYFLNTMNDS